MGRAEKLLLVEDEPSIRAPLKAYLEREEFRVTAVADSPGARSAITRLQFDLAILDIMLPGEDGLSLARWIRSQGELPILFLSARAEDIDRIVGLEIGADDYLTKPFNPRELLARVRSILRRSGEKPSAGPVEPRSSVLTFDGFRLDTATQSLSRGGREIALTAGEYRLLLAFAERAGRTLSREQLLDLTRGRSAGPFDRAVDNAVMRLRRKLGERGAELVRTIHGLGYTLAAQVEKE